MSSEQLSPSNAQRAEVNFAICRYLSEQTGAVPAKEVLEHVMTVVPQSREGTGDEDRDRKDRVVFIRWSSTALVQTGLITKQGVRGLWNITNEGRAALSEFRDAESLYAHVRAVNAERKAAKKTGLGTWGLVDSVIARVPVGKWVSFTDLRAVTGKATGITGVHLWRDKPTGWHRVLRQNGTIPAEAYEAEARLQEQRELLEREGIDVDPRAPDSMRLSVDELELIAAQIKVPPRAWLVRGTSVRGASIVPQWLDEDFVSLPASQLPPLPPDPTDGDIKKAVEEGYEGLGYSQRQAKAEELKLFVSKMQPGHLVMAVSGSEIFIGEITGDLTQLESPGRRSNLRRPTSWINAEEPLLERTLPARLAGRLRASADILDLTEFYGDIAELVGVDTEDESDDLVPIDKPEASVKLRHLTGDELPGVFINLEWVNELIDVLNVKSQVILYGPPGTGKTFLAQEIAEALAGTQQVTLVQFHPSYAYEDFFEGYRPAGGADGGVSLQLVPGPFRKVVDLARANPTQPYFLIIDEINRANLAKVFGELYFLLEYRDRSIDLLYSSGESGPAFSLPANVYIIGTMNTADRSIALVDAAMRRRFGFLSLHPEDENLDHVLRAWLANRGMPEDRADFLVELNRRIADKDFKIGPSYLMSPWAADDAGLERIWKTSILPLLEEYHVGDALDVKKKYGLEALRAALAAENPAAPVGESSE